MYETNGLTRSQLQPAGPVIFSIKNTDPDPPGWPTYPNDVYVTRPSSLVYYERITEQPEHTKGQWNDFEHYKSSMSSPSSGMNSAILSANCDDQFPNGSLSHGPMGDPMVGSNTRLGESGWEDILPIPRWYVPRIDGGFVPPPSDLDQLLSWGLRSILPIVKSELSLINTAIELKDVLTFKSTFEHLKSVPALTKMVFRSPSLRKKTLRELLRVKSDAFLQWNFNVAPLISDILGIYRALALSEKRLRKFINRMGRTRTSHFSKFLVEYTDPPPSVGEFTPIPIGRVAGGTVVSYSSMKNEMFCNTDAAQFHVEVSYNYNYTKFQLEHARSLALLDGLGVNFNPRTVWNAIPWSFVVDWVVDVGQFLGNFAVTNMEPEINIHRCLWSIIRRRTVIETGLVRSARTRFGAMLPPQSIVHPVTTETAYSRHVFSPDVASLEVSGLTPKQVSLGAALVFARGRHFKPRSS